MPPEQRALRGRGATDNPANRFERLHVVAEETWTDPEDPLPRTVFLQDATRGILARNQSPDVGFEYSINPYRGCEHGCIYCYARPTHEYLGFSAGLDFESKILVKRDAPALLRKALLSPRWRPQTIAMSGVTDPYQPVERRLRITRGCLEVLAEFRNPVAIVTKNHLVTRDVDLLSYLAGHGAAMVNVSVTSLRPEVQRLMEPRTSTPARRLDAIRELTDAGVPVRAMIAPVVPGLTDEEVPAIVQAVADAGAVGAAYIIMRLPHAVKDLFADWLEAHFPDRKERVLNRVREVRAGKLNDARFGSRMRGEGPYADQIGQLFRSAVRRAGIDGDRTPLSVAAFRRPDPGGQLGLF
ncbi:MAG TPA: PA0069 family radical SAM protein [Longimicrobiales bacterium]|nr:PA0069 family radical SAM protein [Longimicrobiales bacterium]